MRSSVDPEILRIVGDPGRPRAPVPFSRDLGHLPGESGLVAGVKTILQMRRNGQAYLDGLSRRYGSVFRFMLGPDAVVGVADPDLIWNIMRNEEGIWSLALPWTRFVGGLDMNAPVLLDFEPHRDVRRLLQPSFSAPAIASYLSVTHELSERAVDGWLRRGRINFKAEVRRLFATVTARILMGLETEDEAKRLDSALHEAVQGVLALLRRSSLSPGWWRAKRGIAALRELIRGQRPDGTDLLSRLRNTRDEADWLKDEEARVRLFIGVMFGAFNTLSSASASMGYLLAKHPEWQERLRQEAQRLAAPRPTTDELKLLEQQEWAWKETLRMYPLQGAYPRAALCDTRLGDHRIPSRTFVVALSGNAANDPRFWTEPTRFDPERFSPARAEDKRHKAIYLPFGAGAHTCIGAQLANVEAKSFWLAMLRRCRFRLAPDYQARHGYLPEGKISGDVGLVVEPL